MRKLRSNWVGVDQGEVELFSEYENGGEMWTGDGYRERRQKIVFSEPFKATPAVSVSVCQWDVDSSTNLRGDIYALNISSTDFEIVFNTWDNTRIARIRVAWMAIGEVRNDDEWDIP